MEVTEAVLSRQSIRAYKPDPVPREILNELLAVSIHAPSAENFQPWEFVVVGGAVMEALRQGIARQRLERVPPHLEVLDNGAIHLHDKYRARAKANDRRLFAALGIDRDDKERKREWFLRGMRLFEAPNAIIVCTEKPLGAFVMLDIGIVMQTIMLTAHSYGLGTCAQYQAAMYPDEVRRILGIPESKLVVCGLSIGYPDMAARPNQFRSEREPLASLVTWSGFDEK